jgi:Luciferase-like monooxygenase
MDRLTEFVELLDLLLTSDHVTYEAAYYIARDARTLPGCVRRPRVPLLVAAGGACGQRLALRLGDGWITNGPREVRSEDEWWSGLAGLARAMDASRPPDGFRRLLSLDSCPGYSLSSAARFEGMAGRAAELGFTDVIVHVPRADGVYAGREETLAQVARSTPREGAPQ